MTDRFETGVSKFDELSDDEKKKVIKAIKSAVEAEREAEGNDEVLSLGSLIRLIKDDYGLIFITIITLISLTFLFSDILDRMSYLSMIHGR